MQPVELSDDRKGKPGNFQKRRKLVVRFFQSPYLARRVYFGGGAQVRSQCPAGHGLQEKRTVAKTILETALENKRRRQRLRNTKPRRAERPRSESRPRPSLQNQPVRPEQQLQKPNVQIPASGMPTDLRSFLEEKFNRLEEMLAALESRISSLRAVAPAVGSRSSPAPENEAPASDKKRRVAVGDIQGLIDMLIDQQTRETT